jgi:anti-sigma B factor antagonist
MDIHTRTDGQAVIVALHGRLDAASAKQFDEAFAGWLARGDRRFLFSLGRLEYVSSAGLRCFLTAAKQLKTLQGRMALCGLVPAVAEVFRISGFDTLLAIRDTEAAALPELG